MKAYPIAPSSTNQRSPIASDRFNIQWAIAPRVSQLQVCHHPLTHSPKKREGEMDSKSLFLLGEGFRVRAGELGCTRSPLSPQ
ncbi:MAG: hypothetical protein ACKO3I_08845 [Synechococcales cyanobacterium]